MIAKCIVCGILTDGYVLSFPQNDCDHFWCLPACVGRCARELSVDGVFGLNKIVNRNGGSAAFTFNRSDKIFPSLLAKVIDRSAPPPTAKRKEQLCDMCRWWNIGNAWCQRRSPVVNVDGLTSWPHTFHYMTCGEWESRDVE